MIQRECNLINNLRKSSPTLNRKQFLIRLNNTHPAKTQYKNHSDYIKYFHRLQKFITCSIK